MKDSTLSLSEYKIVTSLKKGKVIRVGNSLGVIIPKFLVTEKGWCVVKIKELIKGGITVNPVFTKERPYWRKERRKIRKVIKRTRSYCITLPISVLKHKWELGDPVLMKYVPERNVLLIANQAVKNED